MFVLNGMKINVDAAITLGDVQYPAGFFRDAAARASVGIVEVADPVRPNEKFYFVTENSDGTLNITEKDVAGVKVAMVAEVKQYASATLTQTDWRVIREAEGGAACPAEVKTFRAAVRTASKKGMPRRSSKARR